MHASEKVIAASDYPTESQTTSSKCVAQGCLVWLFDGLNRHISQSCVSTSTSFTAANSYRLKTKLSTNSNLRVSEDFTPISAPACIQPWTCVHLLGFRNSLTLVLHLPTLDIVGPGPSSEDVSWLVGGLTARQLIIRRFLQMPSSGGNVASTSFKGLLKCIFLIHDFFFFYFWLFILHRDWQEHFLVLERILWQQTEALGCALQGGVGAKCCEGRQWTRFLWLAFVGL